MNAFSTPEPFSVRSPIPGATSLFTQDETTLMELELIARLETLVPGSLLAVDFKHVRIASEAARQLLRRALTRLTSGELADRYIVLMHLGASRYNVKVMLLSEGLVTVHRTPHGPELLGQIEASAAETFAFVASNGLTSARDVLTNFELASIAAATNRLSALARLALARRVGQRVIPGGGREFLYAAVT